ncbi:MAG: tetratricopeptide repeat protein [Proteobacteria bacterium]|nr:tetratricopeptide repeat protein [Pseudomonadota bacterium]
MPVVSVEEALAHAGKQVETNDLSGAAASYRAILDQVPDRIEALNALAAVEVRLGRPHRAAKLLERAMAAQPNNSVVQLNMGRLRARFGDHGAALERYAKAIELEPNRAETYGALAASFLAQQRFRDAESVARRGLGLDAKDAEMRFTLGRALAAQGRLGDAAAEFRGVVAAQPNGGFAHLHLASALEDPAEAAASFKRALALDPSLIPIHRMLGEAMRRTEGDAAAVPHLQRAVELAPADIDAWALLGAALMGEDRAGARRCLSQAAILDRQHLGALKHRVDLFHSDGAFDDANAAFDALVAALPERIEHERDWRLLAEILYLDAHRPLPAALAEQVARRLDAVLAGRTFAFGALPARARPAGDKIRLGYLSGNFGDHPIGHVTASLFATHDRAHFELHGFSLRDRSAERQPFAARHRAGFDQFHDVSRLSPRAVAAAIRDADIDILIELDGHVGQLTAEILAYRPAPLQASLIGHLNGMNLGCVDYLITDRVVVPPGEENRHREHIVRLPDTLHCADRHPIAETRPDRAGCGLPAKGFVFGGFARPDKLDVATIDGWLGILSAVDGSVLWLSEPPAGSGFAASLRARATARDVDPARLVFAARLDDKAAHLARFGHCGLLLDTPVFNAASTALDALWTGVPVLALKGDREGSRVSASLLGALGMPELITESWADYEARAVALARAPKQLAALRATLAEKRLTAPLFNIVRFTRVLEAALGHLWDRHRAGHPPQGFELREAPDDPPPAAPRARAAKPAAKPKAKAKSAPAKRPRRP